MATQQKAGGPSKQANAAAARERSSKQAGSGTDDSKATVRVRAIATGYYDHARRRPGDVFTLRPRTHSKTGKVISANSQFSEAWMERVSEDTAEAVSTAQQAINQQHDEILGGRVVSGRAAEQVI